MLRRLLVRAATFGVVAAVTFAITVAVVSASGLNKTGYRAPVARHSIAVRPQSPPVEWALIAVVHYLCRIHRAPRSWHC